MVSGGEDADREESDVSQDNAGWFRERCQNEEYRPLMAHSPWRYTSFVPNLSMVSQHQALLYSHGLLGPDHQRD